MGENKLTLNPDEKDLIKKQGYLIKNSHKKHWWNISSPEMIMNKEYAIAKGIPKSIWNKSYFKLNGRRVIIKVMN